MPEIEPFAALRYDAARVGGLERVVVPPYDVIKEAERERLAAEPYSGVRLTLTPEQPGDSADSNKYTRSRDLFDQWQREGILVHDETPALYVLAQDFTWSGRKYTRMHLVCACRLYEFDEKVILPHEQILQGPKDDRQNLIEATRANYEPIFGLTLGDSATFRRILREQSHREPDQDVTLPNGERNRVWRIADPAVISALQEDLGDRVVIIADGHHRYNASLGVKREMDAKHGPGPWDFAMMTLAAMDDPDLLVLPTHRMVRGLTGLDVEYLIENLDTHFAIEEWPDLAQTLEAMGGEEGVAIGMLAPEANYVLTPWRLQDAVDAIRSDHSEAWKSLDVSVLHGLVFDRILGIGAGESPHLSYTRDAREAADAVKQGTAQMSFLLKHTPKTAVRTIALLGETMPQKSTYFYPKLLTGLLIRKW